jgi:hypothetical protein
VPKQKRDGERSGVYLHGTEGVLNESGGHGQQKLERVGLTINRAVEPFRKGI